MKNSDRESIMEDSHTKPYLTFRISGETFACDVGQVREVLDLIPITRVPGANAFMRGVVNVRGMVVPVMDLHGRFCVENTEQTQETRIVVMELSRDGQTNGIGVIADSVHEVINLDPGAIQPPPRLGNRNVRRFLRGILRTDKEFIMLLDMEEVFADDDEACIDLAGLSTSPAREKGVFKPKTTAGPDPATGKDAGEIRASEAV